MELSKIHEKVLNNDYPIYEKFLYHCNGYCIASPLTGSVKDLKNWLYLYTDKYPNEVTSCDLAERGKSLKVYSIQEYADLINPFRFIDNPLPF